MQGRGVRVDRPLTYAVPAALAVGLGDVVRVPLGPRDAFGFVISPPRDGPLAPGVRPIAAKSEGPRAFDAQALALARWIAARYCCSLGEALTAVVFAAAVPRVVDRFRVLPVPASARPASVPPRLARLIAEEFAQGFTLDQLVRHPEARRAGDRRTLLAAVGALTRAGAVVRERRFVAPRLAPAREAILEPGAAAATGPRVRALAARVAAAGSLRRRDALLAGFSNAVVARALKTGALRELRAERARRTIPPAAAARFEPTPEQREAIERIVRAVETGAFGELLLHGITGSGKTFVYLRAIARTLELGGRAIVLVPEIALTPQTARRFEGAFGARVAVLHSGLSERERFESWLAAERGEIDVVVGARSAVFAPLPNVRLVVVDEAHERTYKQDTVPRYDTVAVARERMRLARGVLVLGSATPSLESYARALASETGYVRLDRRATAAALPSMTVVDMAAEFERGNRRIFSTRLVAALGARLQAGEKTVLFVNRRGSASFVLCRACGAVPQCTRCSLALTAHRAENLMRCHLCDAQAPLPQTCPACRRGPIAEFGIGTQKVVETAQALFPQARIVRLDSDTTTRVGDHARLLDEFAERGDILVGTQMVAKGLDFAAVTLAAIVAADLGLHVPDFRAAERTFALVTQVAGRSGRASAGEAIVQTYSPRHPAIVCAARHDYDGFARGELDVRRELRYPPFAELTYLGIIGRERSAVVAAAERYAALLRSFGEAEVLGPAPYAIARANDEWRYRIALKYASGPGVRAYLRDTLRELARADGGVRLAINVDP